MNNSGSSNAGTFSIMPPRLSRDRPAWADLSQLPLVACAKSSVGTGTRRGRCRSQRATTPTWTGGLHERHHDRCTAGRHRCPRRRGGDPPQTVLGRLRLARRRWVHGDRPTDAARHGAASVRRQTGREHGRRHRNRRGIRGARGVDGRARCPAQPLRLGHRRRRHQETELAPGCDRLARRDRHGAQAHRAVLADLDTRARRGAGRRAHAADRPPHHRLLDSRPHPAELHAYLVRTWQNGKNR